MENKQDKGFTLVELLIVIVILGILATVTVFAVRGITDQGQDIGLSGRPEDPAGRHRGVLRQERRAPALDRGGPGAATDGRPLSTQSILQGRFWRTAVVDATVTAERRADHQRT